jgi:WD40 repeat protein/serine/threonine protein kinase
MSEKNRCPKCGVRLPTDAPEGLCPKCLMKVVISEGAEVTMESPRIEGPGTTIGRYKLLELIGEGGMGLVYLAEQQEPIRRRAALKIVKLGMDTKQVIARFEAEKQMLALLDHPNIARVYDAGTTEAGRPYFVMEYVKGQSITDYCDQHKTGIEDRLKLFRQVCEGVQYAHQKGIIHRDIKPSNILVTVEGDRAVPKIIDFGIAKAVTQQFAEGTLFTQQGQLLGTPEYMSPEQTDMATQDIDTRSDIYSLGVVLYQLLAGMLPFGRESFEKGGFAEIQRIIQDVDPPNPSTALSMLGEEAKKIAEKRKTQVVPLARRLHRELEWIPLKAMRKERVRRYRSASELADDIQNYLNGNPLLAGPETAIYRVKKFVRRHAGSVATVVLVAAAIILGLVISTAMYFRSERALQREAIARKQAEQAENVAQEQRNLAETKAEDLRRSNYVNNIQLADAKYKEGNIGRVRELLAACPNDLRGWEWNRLNHIQDESLLTLRVGSRGVVVSRDGKRIITYGYEDKTIKIWDLATGKELKVLRGHEDIVEAVDVSPDGKQIVSCSEDGIIKLWDAQTGVEIATARGHRGAVWTLAFSPNGKQIVSGGNDRTIKLWDTETGTEVATFSGHRDSIMSVAFSPNGKRIISGGWNNTIKIWDITTGTEVLTLDGHEVNLFHIAFSPDGKRFVSAVRDGIKVWDAETGIMIMTIRGHDGPVLSVTFSPDGKTIASGGRDNTVRIWDAETGEELKTFRGHDWEVGHVAFSPDGMNLVSASSDNTVKLWDVTIDREAAKFYGHATLTWSIAFSPDGKQIASCSWDSIDLWDAQTGEPIRTMRGHRYYPISVAFSPDGRRIVSGELERRVARVWDASTGAQVMALRNHKGPVMCAAFSPDSKHIVSGSQDRTVKLWDAESGTELKTLQGHKDGVRSVAFSPDGKRIASASSDGIVKIWDAATYIELMTLSRHELHTLSSITFSPDSKRIALNINDRTVKIWDVATGAELMTLRGHRDLVSRVAFSPDGKRIVTGGRDGTAKLWDSTTGAELLTLLTNKGLSVVFSPDGKTIAAGIGRGNMTIMLWESMGPAGGYEPRKNVEGARRLVEKIYSKCGSYRDVISELQSDMTIDSDIRRFAMKIANLRRWEDGDKLRKEAQETVSSSEKTINEYRAALEKASEANALEPNDPAILNTLAAAQYRLGFYEESLKTLTESARILSDGNEDPDPVNISFKAMTLHKIGHLEESKSVLEQLRELCKQEEGLAWDMEVQALLAEAEKLIEGEK